MTEIETLQRQIMDKEEVFEGRRGNYKILRHLPDGTLLVKYVSGEWEGREVPMSSALHERIQFKIGALKRHEERVAVKLIKGRR